MIRPAFILTLCFLSAAPVKADPSAGEKIYRDLCASCHGSHGQGVAGKYDETLHGSRTLESLAGYIHRNMPEDDPEKCVDEEAKAVADFIYHSFYSADARQKLHPARVDLSRLTNRQFRESVADLVVSFARQRPARTPGGLRAEYFQSDGMNKKAKKVIERQDGSVDFQFGSGSPGEGITPEQFSIAWQGSLLAPDTGTYELKLSTPNGARLYVNTDLRAGDANLRDDSDARRHSAQLDLWVSSGGEMRQATTRVFLLGGRSYPLRLDFFKYKETNASIRLEWKPPNGQWAVLTARNLSPENSPALVVVTRSFPPDDASLGYERGTMVSQAWQEAVTAAATETANEIVSRVNVLSGIGENDPRRPEKLREFAARFAAVTFRRPLDEETSRQYVDTAFEAAPTPEVGLKRSVLLILTSPRFLYPDLQSGSDSYAVAAWLALTLWDSLPDKALIDRASRGELLTREQCRMEASRMLEDPRAKAKLREFFHHWLVMDEGADLTKDREAYPDFDAALVADLRESLERFVEGVVWSEASDYRELLLAEYIFLNPRLARFYGVTAPGGSDFARLKMPDGQRAGVLTHPFVLATLSYHKSTSPIHRGVFLTRNMLGRFLKPPPMAISFMDDRFDPALTMREKVTELTKSDTCMACHVTINPLGFSLEHFDAVGRWRAADNNKPVNAESEYTSPDGKVIRLRGARDLAEHAAGNDDARLGFVRQLFQSTVKQAPAAYGTGTLEDLDRGFRDSNHHIRKLLVEIATITALPNQKITTQASR